MKTIYNKIYDDLLDKYLKMLSGKTFKNKASEIKNINEYILREISILSQKISNVNVSKINGIKDNVLYKYRVYIGIISDETYPKEYGGFNSARGEIVKKAIIDAYNKYHGENEKVDLETPISHLYLSTTTFAFIKKSIGDNITLGDLIEKYQSGLVKFGPITQKEIENLIASCGYGDIVGVRRETLEEKYLRLLNEITMLENQYKEKYEEYMAVKQELDGKNK